jgi:hypothetical protein
VQEIGRHLIRHNAVARATMRKLGEAEITLASTILTKLYESAAAFAQLQDRPLLPTGLWGLAIFPDSRDSFDSQLGFVAFALQEGTDTPNEILSGSPPIFAVVNQRIERDNFGFLTITPQKLKTFPIADIPWYDQLPAVR